MKQLMLSVIAGAAALMAGAMPAGSLLKVEKVNIARHDSILVVSMDIDPSEIHPGRDREVRFTPVIRSTTSTDSLVLETITIAGRNRYLLAQRAGAIDDGEHIYSASQHATVRYRAEVPYASWMIHSDVNVVEEVANCCDPISRLADTPVATLDYEPAPFDPALQYIALTGDSTIELSAEGRAFVDFVVNRTEIKPSYRRNKTEIAKIIESIDRVKNDPDAIITRVTIKGYASPEGPYDNNVRLAMGRTNALKEYVRAHYNFDPEIMHSDYEPEDWEGLRAWVETCTLPHRDQLLEIIDSPLPPDHKDHEMRRSYPAEYALMLDSIYPALRHSDYTVNYRIRAFVDVDELKAVYDVNPSHLRPVDFYLIASTYPEGSDKYEEVMLKAVEIYPGDQEANINAANIAISHDRLPEAIDFLSRAGERPEAIYTRAVLAARQGDRVRAAELLQAATDLGFEPASQQLEVLRLAQARPNVKYHLNAHNQ